MFYERYSVDKNTLSTIREMRLMKKAERNAMVKVALLLNRYHSEDRRYYPTEESRVKVKAEIEREIFRLAGGISPSLRNKLKGWVRSSEAWREAAERYDFV